MARDAGKFWRALERRLPGTDEARERQIARSVLALLPFRIGPEEAQQLESELPEELGRLWTILYTARPDGVTGSRIDSLSHNKFLERVQQLARLADVGQAAWATAAVFGAMRDVISPADAEQLEDRLPAGLRELWRVEGAPPGFAPSASRAGNGPRHEPRIAADAGVATAGRLSFDGQGPLDDGASRFWSSLDERLEDRVAATAGAVAGTVLAHLRARLSPRLAGRVQAALPPDLRSYWAGIAPTLERGEPPARFVGRIAQDLDLTADLQSARYATAATLVALRRVLSPDLAGAVAAELPPELRSIWEGEST